MKYDLVHITKKGFHELLVHGVSKIEAEAERAIYVAEFDDQESDYDIIESK